MNVIYVTAFALSLTVSATKSEVVSTNWNGLALKLVIPETNMVIGDAICASLIISNTASVEQVVRWNTGDPCGCGFGLFEITDMSSGKQIKCHIPDDERSVIGAGMINLTPHRTHGFDANLLAGYSLTNSGLYSVRGVHYFYSSEPPTNRQTIPVVTPPIVILLCPKTGTNSPPK